MINQLTQIIHPMFRLGQKEVRIPITAVITTRILHGSISWYTSKNRKSVEKQINRWLFQSIRLSTGMMRQTTSPFLNLYGGLKDIKKAANKLTHNYLHTELTAPVDNTYRTVIWKELSSEPKAQSSPPNSFIEKSILQQQHFTRAENLSSFPVLPWTNHLTNVINLQMTKNQKNV
ncbi:hypothetical protein O181_100135 [Austropuccinia psidii MF-1]|uniref:Uncharacterized protein n=1 Tax=Austropuccinia psidii MF-1 TaxID=1389203 RepID=A0A9Q3PGJ9_9BASI|nr:hypothetical protein [Austropuccinia psidii MF-1]